MISITTTPQAHEWHKIPLKFSGACPICGCLTRGQVFSEHRIVLPEENLIAKWIRRIYTKNSWKYASLDKNGEVIGKKKPRKYPPAKHPDEYHHRGLTPTIRDKIIRATVLYAQGKSFEQIANALEVKIVQVADWQCRHRFFWDFAYSKSLENTVEVVRQLAGTEGILHDPDAYIRMAKAAAALQQKQGKQLFSPPADGEMSIMDVYEKYYEPGRLFDASPRTKTLYRTVMSRWTLVMGNPSIRQIDKAMLERWRNFLMCCRGMTAGKPMSKVTIRNYMRHVQTMLDYCGPSSRRQRDTLGLLDKVPYAKQPKEDTHVPSIVPMETINKVYAACDTMTIPQIPGIEARNWWKAIIVVAFNLGLRRRTLFDLAWDDVDFQQKILHIPPERFKSRAGLNLPINDIVIEHLQRIHHEHKKVFHWPYDMRYFYTLLKRLEWEAGIPRKDAFALHALRRTLATEMWRHDPAAAQAMLGHRSLQTTLVHYVQTQPIMREATNSLPQPEAFKNG